MSIFDEELKMEEDYEDWAYYHNNGSMSMENQDFEYERTVLTAAQVIYLIICVVGLCGNSFVLYVVARFPKMKTVTNLYLVNLAIGDVLFLIAVPFLVVTFGLDSWPFGRLGCKAMYVSTSINEIYSSFFLLVMAADRYLVVCHPMTASKWRTPVVPKVAALIIWTLSALVMVPVGMYANTIEIQNITLCKMVWPESSTMEESATFVFYTFFLGFCIPFIGIAVFSLLVYCRLPRFGRSSEGAEESARRIEPKHQKDTRLMVTIISVYFICWLPHWVTYICTLYISRDVLYSLTTKVFIHLVEFLSLSNSAVNPILYAFLSDSFRESFLKACPCNIFKRKQNTRKIQDQEQGAEMNYTRLTSPHE